MTAGIYAIINTADGMAYVGSSVNIELRWKYHRSTLARGTGPSTLMIEAWRTVGPNAFDFLILETVLADDDALEEAERRWFQRYANRLYNARRVARRGRPDIVTLRGYQQWHGGRLNDYQQRQLEATLRRLERRRPARPTGDDDG